MGCSPPSQTHGRHYRRCERSNGSRDRFSGSVVLYPPKPKPPHAVSIQMVYQLPVDLL